MHSWVHICIHMGATSLLWLLNRLQHIQGFFNIAILAFQQLGQPTTLIAESHGHHLLYCFCNMWSYEQNYLLSPACYMIWIITFITQTQPTKTIMICAAWKFTLRKYKHLNILLFEFHLSMSCVRQLDAGFPLHRLAFYVRWFHTRFVVYVVVLEQGFSEFLQFSH